MILYPRVLIASALAAGRPLTNPRILWQSYARDRGLGAAAVTVSGETDDGPRDAPLREDTDESWLPPSLPATWTLDFGTGLDIDSVGVVGTLGSSGCSLLSQTSSDGAAWTALGTEVAPADDAALLFHDELRNARFLRLSMAGVGAPARIAVVYPGVALAMPRPVDGPYTPITMSREAELVSDVARGGQFLGASVVSYGVSGSAAFKLLAADFVRNEFDAFAKSARQYPYFFAWNPQEFPLEVGYCWSLKKTIKPRYMGMGDFMEVSWEMDGIGVE